MLNFTRISVSIATDTRVMIIRQQQSIKRDRKSQSSYVVCTIPAHGFAQKDKELD